MKKNTKQTNTDKRIKTKRKSPDSDPNCVYAFKTIPVSEAMVEKIAEELLKFPAENPDAKTITEFIISKGLNKSTYYSLVNRHAVLKDAHEITMLRLGERLWGKAVDGSAQWKPVHFMLHSYGPDFAAADLHHAGLRKTEESQPQQITVIMDRIPETGTVPPNPRMRKNESNLLI